MLSAMGITAALMEEELQHAVSLKDFISGCLRESISERIRAACWQL